MRVMVALLVAPTNDRSAGAECGPSTALIGRRDGCGESSSRHRKQRLCGRFAVGAFAVFDHAPKSTTKSIRVKTFPVTSTTEFNRNRFCSDQPSRGFSFCAAHGRWSAKLKAQPLPIVPAAPVSICRYKSRQSNPPETLYDNHDSRVFFAKKLLSGKFQYETINPCEDIRLLCINSLLRKWHCKPVATFLLLGSTAAFAKAGAKIQSHRLAERTVFTGLL